MDSFNLAEVRNQRNQLLSQSDWTQMPDSPLSLELKAAWAVYRQELRDLPNNISNETKYWYDVIFPSRPQN